MSLFVDKGDLVILLSGLHYPSTDIFFKYFTHLGSGFILLFLAIVFLFFSYRSSLMVVCISILQGIVVAFFKVALFPDAPRPATYFGNAVNLNFVEGVDILYWRSFPSGHTLTAFGVATLLAFSVKSTVLQMLLLTYAILVAISRIYLSHHFFVDTLVGALLGIFITLITYLIFDNSALLNHQILDKNLTDRFGLKLF